MPSGGYDQRRGDGEGLPPGLPDALPLAHQQSLPTLEKLKISDFDVPNDWADAAALSRHNSYASNSASSPSLGRHSSLQRRSSGDGSGGIPLQRINTQDFEFIYPGLRLGAKVREMSTGLTGEIEDIIHSRKGSSAKVLMDDGQLLQFFLRDLELDLDQEFNGDMHVNRPDQAAEQKSGGEPNAARVDPWRERRPPGGMRRMMTEEDDGSGGRWMPAVDTRRPQPALPGLEWENQLGRTQSETRGMPLDRKTGAAQVSGIPENAEIKHLLGAVSNAIGANRVNNKVWIANGMAILQFESVTYLDLLLQGKNNREGEMAIKVNGKISNCKVLRVQLQSVRVKFQPSSMGLGWCQTPQKKAGCVVVDVTPNSQADKLGVKRGWIATYVEETALDSRGPIGIIEKHKKKDKPFKVTFQHIVQREMSGGFNVNAMPFMPFNLSLPTSTIPRSVSGKLPDSDIMYSPKASRSTSESGMTWASVTRGSQARHQNLAQGVRQRLGVDQAQPVRPMGATRSGGLGSRGRNVPLTSGEARLRRSPRGSAYSDRSSQRVSLVAQTSDTSGSMPKRKRRSGRRSKKNMDGPKPIYTCPQCATKCNGPQQLQQHIGSAGCKLRQLNLSRVECQPERSVFIGNIPLNCTEKDVLKSLQDRDIEVDKLPNADGEPQGYVIEMRMGKKCKYAVVQLVSADERLKVVTIHHDETIKDKVMITGDIIQYEDGPDGKMPLKNPDGSMVTKHGTVQLDIKPCRPRGEKRR